MSEASDSKGTNQTGLKTRIKNLNNQFERGGFPPGSIVGVRGSSDVPTRLLALNLMGKRTSHLITFNAYLGELESQLSQVNQDKTTVRHIRQEDKDIKEVFSSSLNTLPQSPANLVIDTVNDLEREYLRGDRDIDDQIDDYSALLSDLKSWAYESGSLVFLRVVDDTDTDIRWRSLDACDIILDLGVSDIQGGDVVEEELTITKSHPRMNLDGDRKLKIGIDTLMEVSAGETFSVS
jgi:hypothetical protein